MKKNSHRLNSFIGEVTLFIIHFYFGIYSFFDMLFEKYGIRLYFTLFWDHENKTSKPENYVKLAIAYQYHPILCILVTITICVLAISTMFQPRNEKGKKKIAIILISVLIMILSIIAAIGVVYMYNWEMEAECV
mgnify:CR=1 FL=1